jgi:hypothetical protein
MNVAFRMVVVLAIAGLLGAWAPAPAEHPLIGLKAPEMVLKNYAGADVSLESFKGKQVMLVFWFPT